MMTKVTSRVQMNVGQRKAAADPQTCRPPNLCYTSPPVSSVVIHIHHRHLFVHRQFRKCFLSYFATKTWDIITC